MRIAVDIDDTLSTVDRVSRASAYIERNRLPFRLVDPEAHTLEKTFDWGKDDVLKFIRDGGISVFTEADARPRARETLAQWRDAGDEIVILTARGKDFFPNPVSISRDWLEKRRIPYDEVVAEVEDKGAYCRENDISVLVDDNLEICLRAQELGVFAVLAVGKHNLSRAHEVAYGGANWRQIDAAVRYIRSLLEEE